MNESERRQLKQALLDCAKQNENKWIATGYVVISRVCESAEKCITELEEQIKKGEK